MKATLTDPSGFKYASGCLPRESKLGDGEFKIFDPGKAKPMRTIELSTIQLYAWHRINQLQQGSCAGCAVTQFVLILREIMGLARIILGQAVPYGMSNGGSDSGASIDAICRAITKTGTCPVDYIDQYDWQGYKRKSWPDGWEQEAAKYRVLEWYDCPDLETMKAANDLGFPVVYGCDGHALCRFGQDVNSWGRSWGVKGECMVRWKDIETLLADDGEAVFFVDRSSR